MYYRAWQYRNASNYWYRLCTESYCWISVSNYSLRIALELMLMKYYKLILVYMKQIEIGRTGQMTGEMSVSSMILFLNSWHFPPESHHGTDETNGTRCPISTLERSFAVFEEKHVFIEGTDIAAHVHSKISVTGKVWYGRRWTLRSTDLYNNTAKCWPSNLWQAHSYSFSDKTIWV